MGYRIARVAAIRDFPDSLAASTGKTTGIGFGARGLRTCNGQMPMELPMSPAAQIRDWTYVTVVALLMLSYGFSLLSQGFTARASENDEVRVCAFSGPSGVKTN